MTHTPPPADPDPLVIQIAPEGLEEMNLTKIADCFMALIFDIWAVVSYLHHIRLFFHQIHTTSSHDLCFRCTFSFFYHERSYPIKSDIPTSKYLIKKHFLRSTGHQHQKLMFEIKLWVNLDIFWTFSVFLVTHLLYLLFHGFKLVVCFKFPFLYFVSAYL